MKQTSMIPQERPGNKHYRVPRRVAIDKPDPRWVALQLDRLAYLPMNKLLQTPEGKSALEELVKTLHGRAESREHVVKVIDDLSRGEKFPTKQQILDACRQYAVSEWRADPECEKCQGGGFRPTEIMRNGVAYTASEKCDCFAYFEKQGAV